MNRLLLLISSLLIAILASNQVTWAQKSRVVQDTLLPAPAPPNSPALGSPGAQSVYDNITPLSPTAASLGTYGEVPVSLYTGTPNINIPLYTLSGVELKLPISLSYRAAGIRVEENASWVGLGWSLEAGGIITRTVRDKEDRSADPPNMFPARATMPLLSATQAQKNATFSQLKDIDHADFEADVFNYNFMGMSGSFIFDKNGQPKFSNYSNFKVSFTTNNLNIPGPIIITTDNGTVYEFRDKESTQSTASSTSAWYLTKVTSPTGKEVINFTYASESYGYHTPPRFSKMITPNGTAGLYTQPQYFPTPQNLICTKIQIDAKRLTQITFQGIGTIEFVPSTTSRSDLGLYGSVNDSKYLDELLVKDLAGTVKKRFDFNYEYVETNLPYAGVNGTTGCPTAGTSTNYLNNRLYLTALIDKSSTDVSQNLVYNFKYYDRTTNGKDGLPHKLSAAQDHWGFYNASLNTDLWPGFCGPFGQADAYFVPNLACTPGGVSIQ